MIYVSKEAEAAVEAALLELRSQVETEIDSLPIGELGVLLHLVRGMKAEPLTRVVLDSGLLSSLTSGISATIVGAGAAGAVAAGAGVGAALASSVALRMLHAVPHEDTTMATWNDLIGPFYDTAALTDWLGVSKQAISKRIGKTLLAVHSLNGDVRYPSFQFLDDGRVIPNLIAACSKLAEVGVDEWGQAQWVNTPVKQLGGRTVAETLASERPDDIAVALGLAESQAARLAA